MSDFPDPRQQAAQRLLDVIAHMKRMQGSLARLTGETASAIILPTPEAGQRLCGAWEASIHHADRAKPVPIEHPDGTVWMEATLMGVPIRWPAQKMPLHAGGFRWM